MQVRSKGREGGRSGKWDKVFQAQKKDPCTSFYVSVCDVAASDLREGTRKQRLQLTGASCDHWIIYVSPSFS